MEECVSTKRERAWVNSMRECHVSIDRVFSLLNELEKHLEPYMVKANPINDTANQQEPKPARSQITEEFEVLNRNIIKMSERVSHLIDIVD